MEIETNLGDGPHPNGPFFTRSLVGGEVGQRLTRSLFANLLAGIIAAGICV